MSENHPRAYALCDIERAKNIDDTGCVLEVIKLRMNFLNTPHNNSLRNREKLMGFLHNVAESENLV